MCTNCITSYIEKQTIPNDMNAVRNIDFTDRTTLNNDAVDYIRNKYPSVNLHEVENEPQKHLSSIHRCSLFSLNEEIGDNCELKFPIAAVNHEDTISGNPPELYSSSHRHPRRRPCPERHCRALFKLLSYCNKFKNISEPFIEQQQFTYNIKSEHPSRSIQITPLSELVTEIEKTEGPSPPLTMTAPIEIRCNIAKHREHNMNSATANSLDKGFTFNDERIRDASPGLYMAGHFYPAEGYKRVAWPPLPEGTPERGTTPQTQQQFNQSGQFSQQYGSGLSPQPQDYHQQSTPTYQQSQQQQQQINQFYSDQQQQQQQEQQQHYQKPQEQQYHQQNIQSSTIQNKYQHQISSNQESYQVQESLSGSSIPQTQNNQPSLSRQGSQGPHSVGVASSNQQQSKPTFINFSKLGPFNKAPNSTVAFSGGLPVSSRKYVPSLPGQPVYQEVSSPPPEEQLQTPFRHTQPATTFRGWSHVPSPSAQTVGTEQQKRTGFTSPTATTTVTSQLQSPYGSEPQQTGANQPSHIEQSYQSPENYHQNQPYNQQSYHHPPSPQVQQPHYQALDQQQQQQQQQIVEQNQPEQNYFNQQVRGQSPGVIQLRKEVPISQRPAPLVASQPAAQSFGGGSNMRGDLKWPPPEVKAQIESENEQRRLLTKGPAFRPRRIQKDYSQFFAKHALNATYPGYKIPPGTQHVSCQF